MIRTETQLAIFLENRPGILADICATLTAARINVLALSVVDTVDHAVVRLVVDKAGPAIHLLEGRGLLVVENDVLTIDLPHRPGALGEVARRLAHARVNIEYLYATTTPGQKRATVVLRTSDNARARKALAKKG